MNVSYSKVLPHAFVVSADGLKKLVELLHNLIGKVNIRADCTDDLTRKFNNIDELIIYENPKLKEIRQVHLTARSDDYSKSARISFVNYSTLSISIDFEGCEDVVNKLKDKTLDIIAGMVPSYDFMYRIKFKMIFSIIFGILFFTHMSLYLIYYVVILKVVSVPGANEDIKNFLMSFRNMIYPPLAISYVITFFSNTILRTFFPKAVFTIGQGKLRFEHQEKVRWVVIIGFGVSLAASLVVPIVMWFF